ncbi:MAG: D-sedoheptulose 7-phosphate isomerase [Bacteriovoracaceae bacterium]|jgi:D-sedoheptulose 7-phosphate isomerase
MSKIQELFSNSNGPKGYISGYFNHLSEIFNKISVDELETFINLILDARKSGNTVYFIGNGGSAATASHFANDLAIGTRCPDNPFKVMSLTDNNAVMTAIANDFGYESLFLKQLEVCLNKDDVLVSISASGNSPNLLKAVQYAKSLGAKTVGLTGFDGGELYQMCDYKVHVPTDKGEYGPVEDLHMIFDHIIGTYLAMLVKEKN